MPLLKPFIAMTACAIVLSAATATVALWDDQRQAGAVLDANGRSLAQMLANLPAEALEQGETLHGLASTWDIAAIEFPDGRRLDFAGAVGADTARRYAAPVTRDGVRAGELTVTLPGAAVAWRNNLPRYALLCLPVLVFAALCAMTLRRTLRPLGAAEQTMRATALKYFAESLPAPGSLSATVNNLGEFSRLADDFLQRQSTSEEALTTQTRILGYRKKRIESALQCFPDGVAVFADDDQPIFVNRKLATLLGTDTDTLTQTPATDWPLPSEVHDFIFRPRDRQRMQRLDSIEFHPTGQPSKTFELASLPLFIDDDGSSASGHLLTAHDVTGAALAREARDEFVSHLAHEIKSPLNVINLHAETIAEFGADDQAVTVESVNVIQDEVDRLATLVNDLLNITRIEAGNVEISRNPIKTQEYLEDIFNAALRSAASQGLKTQLDMPRNPMPLMADKDLLRLALNNLLSNAVKYNREGGTVALRLEEADGKVLIHVQDEGIGISAEDQARVFEKFFRADDDAARAREGHGLGLSLAKRVVDAHHGQLLVESVPDEGTTFTIVLTQSTSGAGQLASAA